MQSTSKNTNNCWLFAEFWNEFYRFFVDHHIGNKSKSELCKIVGCSRNEFYRSSRKCLWSDFPNKISANSLMFSKFICNKKIVEIIEIKDLAFLTTKFAEMIAKGTTYWAEILIKKMKDE